MSNTIIPTAVLQEVMDAMDDMATDSRLLDMKQSRVHGFDAARDALRAAMEQSDPAPYLYYDPENGDTWTQEAIDDGLRPPDGLISLYTNQKQAPLTDEQIDGIIRDLDPPWLDTPTGFEEEFCRAIERAHGIGGEA